MAMMNDGEKVPRVATLYVGTPQGYAGVLSKDSQYSFTYDSHVVVNQNSTRAIALAMDVRPASYSTTPLLPVFQTSLPEGYLLDRIKNRFAKVIRMDDMAVLAFSGTNRIGRLSIRQRVEDLEIDQPSETLSEILDSEGSRNLFEELSDRYLTSSGIAGVQPKIVVSATDDTTSGQQQTAVDASKMSLTTRSTLRTRDVIVKIGDDDYPGLSENETCCLEIAAKCGLEVPARWLSKDSKRFVIERFDFDRTSHTPLGFEDMVSITGRVNERKYEGSYEIIARALADFCSPLHKSSSLLALFKTVALSVIVRNGDAHLKNFGLLYSDPTSDDIRLSPVYDLVCTTAYLKSDRLALTLGKSKDWPSRATLIDFGQRHCGVDQADAIIEEMLNTALDFRPEVDRTGIWKSMRLEIQKAASSMLPNGAPIPPRYLPEDSGGPPLR